MTEPIAQSQDALAILTGQMTNIWQGAVALMPSLVIALVILLLTWIVARFAMKIANKVIKRADVRPSLRELIETLIRLGIWIAGLMTALTVLLPGLTPASLFAGLGFGAVAIGFAFQDIFENFLAGILIMLREKMRIGDYIECEGIEGNVKEIRLRETLIRRPSGELTIVPNSILFKNPVKILTDEEIRRHEVIIGVSYDTDLEHAQSVLRDAATSVDHIEKDHIEKDKAVDIFACEFNSSSVDFRVRWWAGSTKRDMHQSKDQMIRTLKRALDDAGIEIPFPYVTHTFKEAATIRQEAAE